MANFRKFIELAFATALVSSCFAAAHAGALNQGLKAFSHRDYTTAARLLRPFAERGDPTSQGCLCFMYANGRGVPQSYPEAASWCRRAANQGNPSAQYMFGILYDKGHGVGPNVVLAYKWLLLAAASATGPKRDFAYKIRDALATRMNHDQIAEGQRLAMQWRPVREP
jgi:uncharacterized protein